MNAEEAVSQETDIRAKSLFYALFQQSALTIVLCDGVIGIFVASRKGSSAGEAASIETTRSRRLLRHRPARISCTDHSIHGTSDLGGYMSGMKHSGGSVTTRRTRKIKVAPMTRAVRMALAASVAALALGASGGFDPDPQGRIAQAVCEQARAISASLGYRA